METGKKRLKAAALIESLRSEIDRVVSPHLSGIQEFALVDFPDHPNVGDSAIWLGEVLFLRGKLGKLPSYVCTYDSWSEEEFLRAVPNGPILFHGGGNFGDIWPANQLFREKILSRFPDRQIIQMPQTIHFSSEASLERAAKVINAHERFVILARDDRSVQVAKNAFSAAVLLCPDMAFCLGLQDRSSRQIRDLLLLLRTDIESGDTKMGVPLPDLAAVQDWLHERPGLRTTLVCKAWFQTLLSARSPEVDIRVQLYQNLAENRVGRGLRQLGSSKYVIADRLHAHILCVLLDLPHTVIDNNYGKIGEFMDTWTNSFEKVVGPVQTLDEAIQLYLAQRTAA
ncbi:exopolysaccharide biosynthesis predicted pyruvyl transferase EpsI [Bradyrhizobium sp. USDA 4474]